MNNDQILQLMANSGRANDSLVAHLSPNSINILKNDGGLGTTNPETGLQEFWGWNDFVQIFVPVAIITVAVFAPEVIPAIGTFLTTGSAEAAAAVLATDGSAAAVGAALTTAGVTTSATTIAVAGGTAVGASAGTVNAIAQGADTSQVIKSAGIGAVAGGVGSGVSNFAGGGITGATAGGAASGATSAELTGQNVGKGAVTGAIGGAISSGVSQGLASEFGGQAPQARIGQGQAYGPATTDNPLGTPIQSNAPSLSYMGGATGFTQTTPEGTYSSSGFSPSGSFSYAYPLDYSPSSSYTTSGDISSLSPAEPPTGTQRALGSLTSQLLTPSIVNSLYPTGSTDRGATTTSIGGGGGSSTGAVLGSSAAPNPDVMVGSSENPRPVWNQESLKSALGI